MESSQSALIQPVLAAEILDLRHRVLRAGLPPESARFTGDESPQAIHLAALDREKIIGCATLHPSDWQGRPAFQLRGMAVDPAYQRHGIGGQLLAEIHHRAKYAGIDLIWANCRMPAIPFYQKHGWMAVSEEFEIPTAGPHRKMLRHL
jgi:GNAT superfamily N-acetyltransferase